MFLFDFEYFSVYSVPVTTRLAGKDGGMIHTFPANITMTFWEDP